NGAACAGCDQPDYDTTLCEPRQRRVAQASHSSKRMNEENRLAVGRINVEGWSRLIAGCPLTGRLPGDPAVYVADIAALRVGAFAGPAEIVPGERHPAVVCGRRLTVGVGARDRPRDGAPTARKVLLGGA